MSKELQVFLIRTYKGSSVVSLLLRVYKPYPGEGELMPSVHFLKHSEVNNLNCSQIRITHF